MSKKSEYKITHLSGLFVLLGSAPL